MFLNFEIFLNDSYVRRHINWIWHSSSGSGPKPRQSWSEHSNVLKAVSTSVTGLLSSATGAIQSTEHLPSSWTHCHFHSKANSSKVLSLYAYLLFWHMWCQHLLSEKQICFGLRKGDEMNAIKTKELKSKRRTQCGVTEQAPKIYFCWENQSGFRSYCLKNTNV